MPKDQNDTASMVSSRSNDVAVKVNAAYYQSRPAIPGNLYSGPDNTRHHRVKRLDDYYVGNGGTTMERTSQIDYITRGPSASAFHRPRHERIGEVGWPVKFYNTCRGL